MTTHRKLHALLQLLNSSPARRLPLAGLNLTLRDLLDAQERGWVAIESQRVRAAEIDSHIQRLVLTEAGSRAVRRARGTRSGSRPSPRARSDG